MPDLSIPFSLGLVLGLNALPGISSLHWSSEGLWLLADNVDGLYQLDLKTHTLTPQLALRPQGDFAEIPKAQKSDFEALAWVDGQLWILGSGSLQERRNDLIKVDLQAHNTQAHNTATRPQVSPFNRVYNQIRAQGLELNIEGATAYADNLLLANRGHLGQPTNHLIRVQAEQVLGYQQIDLPPTQFAGLSALEYEAETDRLWFTATTELTGSVYEDGEIGESYLGWVDGYSKLASHAEIKPSQFWALSQIDPRFAGQKIEGLALAPGKVYLGSDNDGVPPSLFVLNRL